MEFKYFSLNGEIRPIKDAAVPLSNVEYQYGFGVYENIRVRDGIPLFLGAHLERLEKSAQTIGVTHDFAQKMLRASVEELVGKGGKGTFNLKILLVGGEKPVLYIFPLNPHFPDKRLYRDGIHLITYEYERPFPQAKTLNMLESYLAFKKAREEGAYDALLVNNRGSITEGTRTNFFVMRGKTLLSAPESDILPGVTRAAVLHVARTRGFELEERDIGFRDIEDSDSCFITSTSSKILPVRSIDELELKKPPVQLRELMETFDTYLESQKN